jgi:predicted nicotinamide N-methyase
MRSGLTGHEPRDKPLSEGSNYCGPVALTTLTFGGQVIRLLRPADPDRLLDDPAVRDWNRRDDYMPYWAYLWSGAYLLAQAVAREPWEAKSSGSEHADVLEIGCGLGLAGLVALARGLRVQFTDYDAAPLEFVARSISENGFDPARAAVRQLDWREFQDDRFPIILGSDVIYEARLVPLVADVLARLLAPGGAGLIATPWRASAVSFPAAVARHGLDCQVEPAHSQTENGQPLEGLIYRVRRP